jgi:phosphohistidine phosphatase
MMRTLLVMRHAKSSWGNPALHDHDRPLNDRGKRDAPRMGTFLREQDLVPDLMFSSSAKRARKTLKRVADACAFTGDRLELPELYATDTETWIRILRALPDAHHRVLGIGHNPTLEALVQRLTGDDEVLPTAAVAHIELDLARWEDLVPGFAARLRGVWRPRELFEGRG